MKKLNKPQVSVIIINYNTFELTSNCIQSVINKTKEVAYEIILVDNASSECEPELFSQKFPEIKVLKSNTNIGFAKGNNLGIGHASSECILLLNSDVVLKNDAISLCFKKLQNTLDAGVITCKLLFPNGEIQKQCRRFERVSLLLLEYLRIHKILTKKRRANILMNGYFDHETEIWPDRIWGAFFMFRKDMLNNFPEKKLADRFFMYGEDNEWCYQIRKYTNYKILYYPRAEVIHYMGGSNYGHNLNDSKTEAIINNNFICLSEYYGKLKTKLLYKIKGIR